MKSGQIWIAVGFGLVWFFSVMVLFSLLKPSSVLADGNTITVCASGCDYTTIQAAIDAATSGDTVKIAEGTYTHVFSRAGERQIAYISKTVTLKGGYASPNWDTADPDAHPTTLDAQNSGRGIYITDNSHPIIDGIRIINGNATGLGGEIGPNYYDSGGGIYIHRAYPTLQNTKIISCTAQEGGGIFSIYGAITITQSSIISNAAEKWGGGLRSFGTAVTVQDSIIADDVTTDGYSQGGGVYLTLCKPAIFSNNVISHNTAVQAGGGFIVISSDCTFTGNTIANNNSIISGGGGGFIASSSCALTDNIIRGNQAYYDGGAIGINTRSTATLNNNFIESNIAGRYGGGLYIYSDAIVTSTNNIFRGNTSTGSGSGSAYALGNALAVAGAHVNLWHNNFINNSGGQNIGIYVDDYMWVSTLYTSTLMLTNTIIATQSTGIKVENGNMVGVDGILWYNVPVTVTQDVTAVVSVQHQATGNPQFLADGYHIPADSAARKQGVPSLFAIDIDGEPFLNPPDVGVDQYIFGNIYLPLILRNG